jgi:hypothetical protein
MENASLERAVVSNNIDEVRRLLTSIKSIDPNLLHISASRGFIKIAELLLASGLDVDSIVSKRLKYTPLHIAAINNQPEMIIFLLAHGANIESEAQKQLTPFLAAVQHNSYDAVVTLIDSGANLFHESEGKTAIEIASENGDAKIVSFLSEKFRKAKWEGVIKSTSPEVYLLAGGHGTEILGPRTYTIPPDTTLITFSMCGDITFANSVYDNFLDLFCPAEDDTPATIEGRKSVLLEPKDYLFDLEDMLEIPHKTLRIHPSGTPCPNLIYNPLLVLKTHTNQIVSKSGIYKYPLIRTDHLDAEGEHYEYMSGLDDKLDSGISHKIYKESVFPTEDAALHILEKAKFNNDIFEKVTRTHIHDIMTQLGPGIYYYYVCRSPVEYFPFKQELMRRAKLGNVKYASEMGNIVKAANVLDISLKPENVAVLEKIKLIRKNSQELQEMVRKSPTTRRRRDHVGGRFRKSRRRRRQSGGVVLEVAYNQTLGGNNSNPTNIELASMIPEPTVQVMNVEPNTYYTILMFDPDAVGPAPGQKVTYLHWLLVNYNRENPGTICMKYRAPSPPSGSGKHRYTFALYRQTGLLTCDGALNRSPFDLNAFVKANGLTKIQSLVFEVQAPKL